MYILGINAYHGDSSAALIKDGILVGNFEESKIRMIKHWAGLPVESIRSCLEQAGINFRDLDYIAVSRNPFARFHKKMKRIILRTPSPSFLKGRINNLNKITRIKKELENYFNTNSRAKLIRVEHHRSHLASSFFTSPFDEAAVVSIDGFGDFVSTMVGVGRGNRIKVTDLVEFPHSLGIFYTALTQFLGFWNYGDECKLMNLAVSGYPKYTDEMRKIVRLKKNGLFKLDTDYFLHDNGGVEMTWLNEEPTIGKLFSDRITDLLGQPRNDDEDINNRIKDIAASVQAMYEEAFLHILNSLQVKTKLNHVALAGGCLQNSLANKRISEQTPFKEVYISPSAHDGGTSIGAAYYVWNQILDKARILNG